MIKPSILITAFLALGACTKSHDVFSNASADNSVANGEDRGRQPAPQLGQVTIEKPDGIRGRLLYNGKPLATPIDGDGMLSIEHVYGYATKKLYVVQATGGTACPATYFVVAVTAQGASASKEFGTCSDLVKVAEVPGGLSLRMPTFVGPFSEASEVEGADDEHVFTYRDGRITERTVATASSVRITPAWLAGYWVGAPKPTANLECGTDTGIMFKRDGAFYDGGHRGRFRTDGKSVTYYDRVTIDEGAGTESREDFDTPETNTIRADGANAFIEAGDRYQRCKSDH